MRMYQATRDRLETGGFRETTVEELFGLSEEESALIEVRLALAGYIKRLRSERHITQQALAKRLGSDQANISKAERNDETVSLDWMLRAALVLGASRTEIGQVICG